MLWTVSRIDCYQTYPNIYCSVSLLFVVDEACCESDLLWKDCVYQWFQNKTLPRDADTSLMCLFVHFNKKEKQTCLTTCLSWNKHEVLNTNHNVSCLQNAICFVDKTTFDWFTCWETRMSSFHCFIKKCHVWLLWITTCACVCHQWQICWLCLFAKCVY